jgi:hypothetical protein
MGPMSKNHGVIGRPNIVARRTRLSRVEIHAQTKAIPSVLFSTMPSLIRASDLAQR